MADPINWSNPPKPGGFCQVTLKGKHLYNPEPAILDPRMLVVRRTSRSRVCAALPLNDVLYYVREAALKYPEFRAELDRMLASLPSSPKPEGDFVTMLRDGIEVMELLNQKPEEPSPKGESPPLTRGCHSHGG